MDPMEETTDTRALLDEVVRVTIFAADEAVAGRPYRGRADETRAAVTEAFRCALGNGLIELVPQDRWPEYLALSAPYEPLGSA
jgi:hypothetical protein